MPLPTTCRRLYSPRTFFMSIQPGGPPDQPLRRVQRPSAKTIRSVARWVISTLSPAEAKVTVCSPTMSPARSTEKPMLPGARGPPWPIRP